MCASGMRYMGNDHSSQPLSFPVGEVVLLQDVTLRGRVLTTVIKEEIIKLLLMVNRDRSGSVSKEVKLTSPRCNF